MPRQAAFPSRIVMNIRSPGGVLFLESNVKDAYYFRHDANARSDPKIKALLKNYGIEGYGRFWVIIEMLREASGYRLEDEEYMWDAIAEQMNCEVKEVRSFIDDCINKFKLFTQEDGFFYSASLLERMIRLDEIKAKRRDAAHSRWDNA